MGNVLILDDNHELIVVLREAVELAGHTVRTAQTGTQGLNLLVADFEPDVIVCDLEMPDMDGITFIERLRSEARWAQVAVITMSGKSEADAHPREFGANAYIPKPFSLHDLIALIDRYISKP
ncbi:MAG: response regulator [Chloroflexi bacterium]|nr:response regulator [Chloroflexota bacterium]